MTLFCTIQTHKRFKTQLFVSHGLVANQRATLVIKTLTPKICDLRNMKKESRRRERMEVGVGGEGGGWVGGEGEIGEMGGVRYLA